MQNSCAFREIHMRKLTSFTAVLALVLAAGGPSAIAAVFNVSTPADFQAALTTAQANGENDVINVLACSGGAGVCTIVEGRPAYDISTPLTYTAAASEGQSLTIDGTDLDFAILDGGVAGPILRIDTRAANDTPAEIVVQDLILINGNAVGTPANGGALAIFVDAAFVRVAGSVLANNAADENGGALYISAEGVGEAPITLEDLTFDTNEARGLTDGTGHGGAAYVRAPEFAAVQVFDVDFLDGNAAGNGGCLAAEGLPSEISPIVNTANIDDVLFDSCTAGGDGGGAFLAAQTVNMEVTGFVRNVAAGAGGGLFVANNWIDLTMINSGFAGNQADTGGGGFYVSPPNIGLAGFASIINNTLVQNTAVDETGEGGNAYLAVSGSTGYARIYNNIVYDGVAGGNGDDIYINNNPISDIPVSVFFYNNDITTLPAGGFPNTNAAFFIVDGSVLSSGGNIAEAPILPNVLAVFDPPTSEPDPSQGVGSPTIDAGLNTPPAADPVAFPGIPTTDFDDVVRPLDGDGDSVATVDIGMDEFEPNGLPSADLSVVAVGTPDPVTGLTDLAYSVTVANGGPDQATNVELTATLAAGLNLASTTATQGSCTGSGEPVVVVCTLDSVADGGDVAISIVVTAPDVASNQNISSTFAVSADEGDPVAGNDSVSVSSIVVPAGPPQADLRVTKNDAPDPVFSRGQDLTYTVTVQNNGPSDATGVTLTDTLPIAAVTFRSATPSNGGTCGTPDGDGELQCDLGNLAVDGNTTVTIVVTPDVVAEPVQIANTVTVAGNEDDPNGSNNTTTAQTTVNPPQADLSVTLSVTPDEPSIDEQVTVTVTVASAGPSESQAVALTVTLPAQATVESITPDQGSCTITGTLAECALGALAANDSVDAAILLRAPGEATTLSLAAVASGDAADPDDANDSAEAVVNVIDTVEIIVKGKGGKSGGAFGWLELLFGGLALLFVRSLSRGRAVRRAPAAAALSAAVIVLAAALPATPARAEGWYVGAAGGQADADYGSSDLVSDLAVRGWPISDASADDNDTAWKIYAGWQVTDRLALEGGYVDLGEVTTQYRALVPPNQIDAILQDTLEVHPYLGDGWTAAGVVRLPLGGPALQLLGRIGVFAWEADIEVEAINGATGVVSGDDDGADLFYGLGVEWQVQPRVGLTLEWERYKLDQWVDVPLLGLRVIF